MAPCGAACGTVARSTASSGFAGGILTDRPDAFGKGIQRDRIRRLPAKTLHDGLQQLLVIVALNLEQQVRHDSERGAPPSELLSEAQSHLEEAIAAARSLNFDLFPPVLQQSGLPAALTWLANRAGA